MKVSKRQLRRIIKEERIKLLREQTLIPVGDFQEQIEWGEWPGRPLSFEWDYVEQESSKDLRFDWGDGSMWYRAYPPSGEVEGNIPEHLIPHLKKMGIEVYAE
jgi:hypothetical protein